MNKYYIYGVNFKDNGKIYNFKSKIKSGILPENTAVARKKREVQSKAPMRCVKRC